MGTFIACIKTVGDPTLTEVAEAWAETLEAALRNHFGASLHAVERGHPSHRVTVKARIPGAESPPDDLVTAAQASLPTYWSGERKTNTP